MRSLYLTLASSALCLLFIADPTKALQFKYPNGEDKQHIQHMMNFEEQNLKHRSFAGKHSSNMFFG